MYFTFILFKALEIYWFEFNVLDYNIYILEKKIIGGSNSKNVWEKWLVINWY